jgi:hypothetical protein
MARLPNISRRTRLQIFLGFLLVVICQPAFADIAGPEDETQYEVITGPSFKTFHKKHGRFPRNWIELGIQDSCGGYTITERKHFPKANEAIIWRPSECFLSYKLVFSGKNSFRVVALAKGHVVSVYENFKATFYKTPYYNREPPEAPEGTVY